MIMINILIRSVLVTAGCLKDMGMHSINTIHDGDVR